jgi:hypothetical protein
MFSCLRRAWKGVFAPVCGQTAPVPTGGEVLQQRSLGVDEDGLFISGPAVVAILNDNRPIDRRFDFALMRVGGLLPQPEMAEDAFLTSGS